MIKLLPKHASGASSDPASHSLDLHMAAPIAHGFLCLIQLWQSP